MSDESFETATAATLFGVNGDSVSAMAGGIQDLKQSRIGKRASNPQIDRMPPHSIEAEKGVLGCVLLSPQDCINQCAEKLASGLQVFYDLRHQEIYRELMAMQDEKIAIDVITLQQRLRDRKMLEQIGGIPYLNELQDSVPSAANVGYYCDIVSEKYILRRILQASASVSERVYDFGGNVETLLGEFERDVLAMNSSHQPKIASDGKTSGDLLADDLERRMALEGKLSGLDTGLVDLNRKLEGLQFGEQVVIAARPSMGKTALGLGMFAHLSLNLKVPSLFISLEMCTKALMSRMLSQTTGIPMNTIKRGDYTEGDFKKFIAFRSLCCKSPMFIVEGLSGMTSREISAIVRRMVLKHGIKFVVVDYLQKVKADIKHEKRNYEVADISGKLRAVGVETNVAMMTLAQINRDSQKDKGRLPRLSDLADSGQIERDADTVILIHRDGNDVLLLVAKQRDGETGAVKVFFDGSHCKFSNATTPERSDSNWPNKD